MLISANTTDNNVIFIPFNIFVCSLTIHWQRKEQSNYKTEHFLLFWKFLFEVHFGLPIIQLLQYDIIIIFSCNLLCNRKFWVRRPGSCQRWAYTKFLEKWQKKYIILSIGFWVCPNSQNDQRFNTAKNKRQK